MAERVEWGNAYILQPGHFDALLSEREARATAAAYPEWRRLVKRTVIESDWEEVDRG